MSARILFIHGLASCGNGTKARALADHFGRDNLVAPDLPMDPGTAMSALMQILSRTKVDLLVGSSLGGYYASSLNRISPIPTVLVNPTTEPWVSLKPHLGRHENWCSGEPAELSMDHLRQLRDMTRRPDPTRESYLVILGQNDEVLDHRVAADFYREFQVLRIPNDDHRLRKFSTLLPDIEAFRNGA